MSLIENSDKSSKAIASTPVSNASASGKSLPQQILLSMSGALPANESIMNQPSPVGGESSSSFGKIPSSQLSKLVAISASGTPLKMFTHSKSSLVLKQIPTSLIHASNMPNKGVNSSPVSKAVQVSSSSTQPTISISNNAQIHNQIQVLSKSTLLRPQPASTNSESLMASNAATIQNTKYAPRVTLSADNGEGSTF